MPTPAATRIRKTDLNLRKCLFCFNYVVEFIFHICEGDRISESFFWAALKR